MSDKTVSNGEFCWNELMTGDTAKAKSFYGELLGWEANDMDMGETTYTIFKKGDNDIAGMLETPPNAHDIPPHWLAYINVDDLENTMNKCAGLGATVVCPIKEIPNYGHFAVIQDPTGAHIAFWQKG